MYEENINGVTVKFPYKPYEVQRIYMQKVIECIENERHGLLESPTGTGKTLSLLCAALSWQEHRKRICDQINLAFNENSILESDSDSINPIQSDWTRPRYPKIIYASRTHTQLSQVMVELKRTAFSNTRVTILGSREQMCIHPIVKNEPNFQAKNNMCNYFVRARTCNYHRQVSSAKESSVILDECIVDMEDLIQKSKNLSCCPYYLARELEHTADIVFMPYNYLLDPNFRKSMVLQNKIIILDEAHNVDRICEDSSSIKISTSDILFVIDDLKREMENYYNDVTRSEYSNNEGNKRTYSPDDVAFLRDLFTGMLKELENTEMFGAYKGSALINFLKNANITFVQLPIIIQLLEKITEQMTIQSLNSTTRAGGSLQKMGDNLQVILSNAHNVESADNSFRVFIENEERPSNFNTWMNTAKNPKIIHFWCFNPGVGMNSLIEAGIRCLILSSGTLSPINAIATELMLHNPVILENPHVINNNQVHISVIKKGPRNIELSSAYQNRSNEDYWQEMGLTLLNFTRIVPDGILVFFPSYFILTKAVSTWTKNDLWPKILNIKPIFVESDKSEITAQQLVGYADAVREGRGGILMGVCRGRISEGMDFTDNLGRAAIVFGLPYPPFTDPKVKLKREYVDENKSRLIGLDSNLWYKLQAVRAVNQAIGRVIRHANDYGAILLCDARFAQSGIVSHLSKWLRPLIKEFNVFGPSISQLRLFFRNFENVSNSTCISSSIKSIHSPSKQLSATNAVVQKSITDSYIAIASSSNVKNCYNTPCKFSALSPNKYSAASPTNYINASPSKYSSPNKAIFNPYLNPTTYKPSLFTALDSCDKTSKEPLNNNASNIDEIINNHVNVKKDDVMPAKKRKIKLIPIRFDDCTAEAGSKEFRLNRLKQLISEIKATVDEDSYKCLMNVVKNYQKNSNFSEFLTALIKLFPNSDEVNIQFFKDCEQFFLKSHRELFLQYYNDNYATN